MCLMKFEELSDEQREFIRPVLPPPAKAGLGREWIGGQSTPSSSS